MSKTRFGVSVDGDLATEIDAIVEETDDLDAGRSEVINAILTAFFSNDDTDHTRKVRELIIKIRKGNL